MLITRPQVNIVSRIVTAPTGELVRAFFALVTVGDRVEVRFLGTKPLNAEMASTEAPVALLETVTTAIFGESVLPAIQAVISPFFSLDFLTSQPTRAPNLI